MVEGDRVLGMTVDARHNKMVNGMPKKKNGNTAETNAVARKNWDKMDCSQT